jgi:hypothetical protein
MKLDLFVQDGRVNRDPTDEELRAGVALHARINELHLQLTAARRECQQQGHILRFTTSATPDDAPTTLCYTCGEEVSSEVSNG